MAYSPNNVTFPPGVLTRTALTFFTTSGARIHPRNTIALLFLRRRQTLAHSKDPVRGSHKQAPYTRRSDSSQQREGKFTHVRVATAHFSPNVSYLTAAPFPSSNLVCAVALSASPEMLLSLPLRPYLLHMTVIGPPTSCGPSIHSLSSRSAIRSRPCTICALVHHNEQNYISQLPSILSYQHRLLAS